MKKSDFKFKYVFVVLGASKKLFDYLLTEKDLSKEPIDLVKKSLSYQFSVGLFNPL